MEKLTIFGGSGFVGGEYVRNYYDAAVGNIVSVNTREDKNVHSKDVLYFISTVHNFNVYTDPLLDINTNLVTLIEVLESWRARWDASDGVFNFVSSWFVCSDVKGFYTSTKRCAEELLESYCKAFGLKYRILRLSNVVGSGDNKVSSKKNALQFVVKQIIDNKDIVASTVFREYTYVEDCARAIDLVLISGDTNTTYNIGSGTCLNFSEAVRYVAIKTHSTSKIEDIVCASEPSPLDTTKLRDLGFKPKYTGTSILDKLLEDMANENSNSRNKR